MESTEAERPRVTGEEIDAAVELGRRITRNIATSVEVRGGGRRRPRRRRSSPRGTSSSRTCPGVGKTTLARSLARSLDLEFARVQCTADLLPADVVGVNVFNRREDRFEFRPGPDLRERRARRRDQPRVAQDAVRSARVHAGAPRHRRRPHARARAPVRRARDAEPGRVRGHVPAARGAGRPVHDAPVARLPARQRARPTCWPRTSTATASRRSSPSPTPRRCSPRRTRRSACTPRRRCASTSSRCSGARARTRASSSARARAPASCCCAPRRPGRSCRAATTHCPTTCSTSPRRCSSHRLVLTPEALDLTGDEGRRRRSRGDPGDVS